MFNVELRTPSSVADAWLEPAAVGLIGPGNVGSRVLSRLADHARPGLSLVAIADSKRMLLSRECLSGQPWRELLDCSEDRSDVDRLTEFVVGVPTGRRILIDATASREVAGRHADWLAAGFEVVTANKWAAAGSRADWSRLARPNYRYATTVGAGLPILDTLSGLRRAGDRVLAIEGILSGTLSYLTAQVAAGHGFAESVRAAHRAGLTEPDPRLDLGGVDVARKLVIAARAAGLDLELDEVAIDSLVPPHLADVSLADFLDDADGVNAHWVEALRGCPGRGSVPCHVGRVIRHGNGRIGARVGLQRVAARHPFAAIHPGDNIVAITTAAYRERPIWIRGPGAGADITALQVCSDVLAAAQSNLML